MPMHGLEDYPIGQPAAMMPASSLPSQEMEEGTKTTGDIHHEEQDAYFHDSNSRTYTVPVKGEGAIEANGSMQDNYDIYDANTVTTASASEPFTIDGMSADSGSYERQDIHEICQICNYNGGLDWSFLQDGELFDRQEHQRQLLDIFYRQMNMGTVSEYDDGDSDCCEDDENSLIEYQIGEQAPRSLQNIVQNYHSSRSVNNDRSIERYESSQSFRGTRRSDRVEAQYGERAPESFRKSNHGYQSSRSFRPCDSNKEFVIVSGLSGTGKTILVEETLKHLVTYRGGYFLLGKLDQLNRANSSPHQHYAPIVLERPYAPFVMAFSNFVESVVKKKDVTVAEEIRSCVCTKMTDNDIDLILEIFPSLARLIRPQGFVNQQDTAELKSKVNVADNQKQLARVVRIFLEAISDPQTRPIVLLIDDLQWADNGTLVLLRSLLSGTEDDPNKSINGFFLVGTCRHNEVTVEDKLATLLCDLEDEENVSICQIEVSNLTRPVCSELFARVLGVSRENFTRELASSLDPLVDIAYEKTKGNAFFFMKFIQSLHDDGYLQIQPHQAHRQKLEHSNRNSSNQIATGDEHLTNDISDMSATTGDFQKHEPTSHNERHSWSWNPKQIRRSSLVGGTSVTNDAVAILARQIRRLPSQLQEILMIASCLGADFDKRLLLMAMPTAPGDQFMYSSEKLFMSLQLLIEKDLLRINTESWHYQFCHDKIQQAAIALINDNDRASFCTDIGRRILEQCTKSGEENVRSKNVFLIVNLFSHGISAGIINDRSELMMVATLAFEAGNASAAMSDFVTAGTYLNLGIKCLQNNFVGERSCYWEDEYEFSLSIFNTAAEVAYCTANYEHMDSLIKEILQNARQFHDKMVAYRTMIFSLGSRERLFECIAQGFSLLEVLGERFPAKDLKILLLFDLLKTKKIIKKFDIDFEQTPQMKDKNKIAAMEILNILFPYLMMLKHPKAPHVIFRMVQLTVEYGITETSATGFAGYGLVLCGIGDYVNGNRYGRIGMRLLDHFNAKGLKSRVYCMYYGFISNWDKPLAMNLEPSMDGHRIGLSTGDIEFGGACSVIYSTNCFHAGQPLDFIENEVSKLQNLTIVFRQKAANSVISPILQQVYNLKAGIEFCKTPWILSGEACDEESLVAQSTASNNVMCLSQFNFRKMWMAYVFNNYKLAFKMAEKSRITMKSSPAAFMVYSHYFFEGMTCMALAQKTVLPKKTMYVRLAKKCLRSMKKAANHCKLNCLNKYLMLKAELRIIKGDLSGGLELFEKSASISEEEGFIHERAIAYERAALAVLYLSKLQSGAANEKPCTRVAGKYYTKAMKIYRRWGATTKVDQMIAEGLKLESGNSSFWKRSSKTSVTCCE